MLWLLGCCFMELLIVGAAMPLTLLPSTLLPSLRTLILLPGCLVQSTIRLLFCLVVSCFVRFGCCLLEAWSFLKRNGEEGSDSGIMRGCRELGLIKEGKFVICDWYIFYEKRNQFSIIYIENYILYILHFLKFKNGHLNLNILHICILYTYNIL